MFSYSHSNLSSKRAAESTFGPFDVQQASSTSSISLGSIFNGFEFRSLLPNLPFAVVDDFRDRLSDTTAPLGTVSIGGSVKGKVESVGDTDLFAVTLTAGQTYTFDLKSDGGRFDPYLTLRNANGTALAVNDDFGGGVNSRISFTAKDGGTYYVEAKGFWGSTGNYTLTAAGTGTGPGPVADDFRDGLNDTSGPLGTLAAGGTARGAIETAGDKDVFAISLEAGKTYTFDLKSGSTAGLSDPSLRLVDGNGNQLAANNDFGGSRNSQITFDATKSGTFYLVAGDATANGRGSYTLSSTAGKEPPVDPSGGEFDIQIRFNGDARFLDAFEAAAERWEAVIVGDIPDFQSSRFGPIDDLLIDASAISIDGQNGVLGRAGPDQMRSGSLLPAHGIMEFDTADLQSMTNNGTLVDVIVHEMGHVLGLGTLWDSKGLKADNFNYTGQNALEEYRLLSGNTSATSIPLERSGGPGTAGGHWAESVFGSELMTGFASGGMEMSRMTIAALEDLGYAVDYSKADEFSFGMRSIASEHTDTGLLLV
jgi:hypothetical protein